MLSTDWQRATACDSNGCVEARWVKSSASAANGNCVEVGIFGFVDGVMVRDSKDPDGPVLSFTREEWDAFLAGVRGGEFDL